MNCKCEMIRDILPLYAENMCSEETCRVVTEHLSDCEECRKELELMNETVAVRADSDISVLKRIKRRARTENILAVVMSVITVIFIGKMMLVFLLCTDCSMDYEKYGLAENVWVEEQENGDLMLCTKAGASTSLLRVSTVSDENGNHLGYRGNNGEFDPDKKAGFGVTLKQRKIDSFAPNSPYNSHVQSSLLFNAAEKPDYSYVFYYDDVNNTEYILWERSK